ncbi:MAG: autotransporter domain-containing protein [Rickettsiales bacterium]|nr:autotransporter domain-containing protein [Rickettsiales bacterium]
MTAFSADIFVDSEVDTLQSFSSDNQKMIIGSGGNLSKGISGYDKINTSVEINASDSKGVASTSAAIVDVFSVALNSGSITGSIGISTGVSHAGGFSVDRFNFTSSSNTFVRSSSNAIVLFYAKATITNSGSIISSASRGIASLADITIHNSGLISGKAEAIYQNRALQLLTIENTDSGTISGAIESSGIVNITNNGTLSGDIKCVSGCEIDITNNAGSITGNITLGSNNDSSFSLNGGTVTGNLFTGASQLINLNAGSFVGDIYTYSGSTINLGSTTFNGSIESVSSDYLGTLNLTANRTLDSNISIGVSKKLDTVNIASGTTVTQNGSDIRAKNLNIASNATLNLESNLTNIEEIGVAGTLNFGDTTKTVAGNVSGSGAAIFNANSASHTINGNILVSSGDTISLNLSDSGSIGKFIASGSATIAAGAKLSFNFGGGEGYKYLADGSQYTIVDGSTGSSISTISDSNISLNNSGSNKLSLLTVSTLVSGDDLVLNINRASSGEIFKDQEFKSIYDAINTIGSGADGKLKEFQQYLDSSSDLNSIKAALKSAAPQQDNSSKLTSLSVVNNLSKIVEGRLDAFHSDSLISDVASRAKLFKTNFSSGSISQFGNANGAPSFSFASGNEVEKGAVWAQTFGNVIKRGNIDDNGYESNSVGLAFGADTEFSNSIRGGLSFSYANSYAKSSDDLKSTRINTYQITTYAGKSFGKYFLDGVAGFALSQYSSSRSIPSVDTKAHATYYGQNYIAKLRSGALYNFKSGFNIMPELSGTFVRSNTNSYLEEDADTLNLKTDSVSSSFLEGRAGIGLGYRKQVKNGSTFSPKITASYGYNFLNKSSVVTSRFAGEVPAFQTYFSKIDPRSFRFGGELEIHNANSTTFSIDYFSERRSKFILHSLLVGAKYEF